MKPCLAVLLSLAYVGMSATPTFGGPRGEAATASASREFVDKIAADDDKHSGKSAANKASDHKDAARGEKADRGAEKRDKASSDKEKAYHEKGTGKTFLEASDFKVKAGAGPSGGGDKGGERTSFKEASEKK
jgi:hypothetical protein